MDSRHTAPPNPLKGDAGTPAPADHAPEPTYDGQWDLTPHLSASARLGQGRLLSGRLYLDLPRRPPGTDIDAPPTFSRY